MSDTRGNIDRDLWKRVQRIVYPKRAPSDNAPLPAHGAGPKRWPASWLYHLLASDAVLRAKVLP